MCLDCTITLTTDFGLHDSFVGIMKGVILQINPKVQLIDLSHEIPAYNTLEASFVIDTSYKYFPEQTIHLIVVDPGVGSNRRPILVRTDKYFFVAPDNGVLSYIYHRHPDAGVFHVNQSQYFRSKVSLTFHGRDVFAPVAAWLSTGLSPQALGYEIEDYVRFKIPSPSLIYPNVFEFQIIHVDRFGNLITNIEYDFFKQALSQVPRQSFSLEIASYTLSSLEDFYASLPFGQIGAILGSSGYIEIFINQNRADQMMSVNVGDIGKISFL